MADRAPDLPFEDMVDLLQEWLGRDELSIWITRNEVIAVLDGIKKLRKIASPTIM